MKVSNLEIFCQTVVDLPVLGNQESVPQHFMHGEIMLSVFPFLASTCYAIEEVILRFMFFISSL